MFFSLKNNLNMKKILYRVYVSKLTNKINVKLSKGELILSAICQFDLRVTHDIDAPTRWDSSPMRLIMKRFYHEGKDVTASTASSATRAHVYTVRFKKKIMKSKNKKESRSS